MIVAFVLVLILVPLVGGALLGLGWMASDRAMRPPPAVYAWRLDDYPTLDPEEVTFTSTTGVKLVGRIFAGRTRATIILSHGYGSNQDEMLPVASFLHDVGFSVFTYDLRGCGRSDGRVAFGALEQQDLICAVDYLVSRSDIDEDKIGALGFSMGAATTILAAARDSRIKAVVGDSGPMYITGSDPLCVRYYFNRPRRSLQSL